MSYNKDIIADLGYIPKCSYFGEWYRIVEPILNNEEFQKRKYFKHHDNSVWNHCVSVSFEAFLLAKYYHLNERVAAIAGLLHDFYPKAWQYSEELEKIDPSYLSRIGIKQKPSQMHGFVHAREAAVNAQKYFPELMDERIINSIKRHMFPLNIIPPKYLEGWLITVVDKKVSASVLSNVKELPGYVGINVHIRHKAK